MKAIWPVNLSCEVLGVSVSGHFEHQRRQQRRRPSLPGSGRLGDEALLAHLRAIHAEVRQEYGWPRMTKELCARGHRVGKERVRRLMQQCGMKARGRRKFVVTGEARAFRILDKTSWDDLPPRVEYGLRRLAGSSAACPTASTQAAGDRAL